MGAEQAANPLVQFFPFIAIIMIFYFLVIKPEKDKQKERKERLGQLKKNDQIVTAGGVHGTIVNVKTATVIVRIDDNVKVEIDKEAVATVKVKEGSS